MHNQTGKNYQPEQGCTKNPQLAAELYQWRQIILKVGEGAKYICVTSLREQRA